LGWWNPNIFVNKEFQKSSTTPSGRKITRGEEEEKKKKNVNIGHSIFPR
jgi:hypothetical protein